jgi:hypothetical protein
VDGSYNDGEFLSGVPHGKVKEYQVNGAVYEGNFICGKKDGFGE